MYEGAPDYPHKGIWWELIERYGVSIFYTAPTAIRACMKWGAEHPNAHDLSSLRLLGTVGEPINPKAWLWYHVVIGRERCPIVDTWWQTETGQIMISPLPGLTETKPGSATFPLPGVVADVVDETTGESVEQGQGLLVLKRPWPGDAAHAVRRRRALRRDVLLALRQRHLPRRRRGDPRQGRIPVDRRADRRRDQRLRAPALDRRGRVGDRRAREGRRSGRRRPVGRAHRPGDRRVRDPPGRPRGDPGDRGPDPRARRRADRQARAAEADPVERGPAQDALGEDHAPAAARHRRGPRRSATSRRSATRR